MNTLLAAVGSLETPFEEADGGTFALVFLTMGLISNDIVIAHPLFLRGLSGKTQEQLRNLIAELPSIADPGNGTMLRHYYNLTWLWSCILLNRQYKQPKAS
jgi:hypothetical protein